ncbi:MAG: MipA/OmpV family protein, partial [Marinicella sp.]
MKLLIIILFILATGMLKAQPVPDSPPNEHELQIGLATVVSDSIYTGGKTQYKVFPAVDYQYKRFYFQAGDMGFNMIDTDDWEVNFGLGVDLVGDLERGDSRIFSDLPDLSYPVNTFLSARYKSPIGLFKVKHNYEVNNKHNGQSSSLSYAAPIFKGKWLIMPQLSYNHYSSEVVNYFFGVDPLDASDSLPSYQSGAVNS